MTNKIDTLGTLIDYHEDIREVVRLIGENKPATVKDLAIMLVAFCNKNLVNHFKFEELVIFPAVAAFKNDQTMQTLINQYIEEHGELLRTISLFASPAFSEQSDQDRFLAIKNATNKLHCHAKSEDEHIVPLMKAFGSLRILIGRAYLKNRSAVKLAKPAKPGPAAAPNEKVPAKPVKVKKSSK